jgi:A/G-specific adenine glycosylase
LSLPQNAHAFRRALLRWYRRNARDLPWRPTRDPYAILVSEFMLQQTQVATVLPYYNEWLRRFPNFAALAHASDNDILHAWQGLGYYARARNLHATAKLIVDQYRGRFPRNINRIKQLPGIGRYIAHAVATFAFDQPVPIVEANTARVLSRLFNLQLPVDQTAGRDALWDRAASLLPQTSARLYNSALIDLGALICLPRPKCEICPVKQYCCATIPEVLPIKKARPRTKQLTENHIFAVRKKKILLHKADHRWRGLWILPPLQKRSTMNRVLYSAEFPFTHHRITLRVFRSRRRQVDPPKDRFAVANNHSQRWFRINSIDSIPIPAPHRRAIASLLSPAPAQS